MDYVNLGATGIRVNKNGFGALPIQRISENEAGYLLEKAFQNSITFFDTARDYTDSEWKMGLALSAVRDRIYIATKTSAKDKDTFWKDIEVSLKMLKTDYIDIYQFHNPPFCPKPGDGTGLYEAVLEAKSLDKVKFIGITCHRLEIAKEAAVSGLYDTIQYPISYLSSEEELDFVSDCKWRGIGVLGMKALSGGLITDSAAAYAFLAQFDNIIPIWGIQREHELDEFLSYQESPPMLDKRVLSVIEKDKAELTGEFCRGCGYCMPCPAGIGIPMAARMTLLIQRSAESFFLGDMGREAMRHADDCADCGHCIRHCPYGIDVPRLVREGWAEYQRLPR